MHTRATTDTPHSSHDHGDPLKAYLAVFGTLMILLFITVGAYFIPFEKIKTGDHGDLGWVNTAVALVIATTKTLLVVLFFMHLRHSTRLTWVVASAGFVFLGIMILFFFTDFNSRKMVSESEGGRSSSVEAQAGTHANGEVLLYDTPNQVQTDGW
jgi:cytochrome c oxidase subunit 4